MDTGRTDRRVSDTQLSALSTRVTNLETGMKENTEVTKRIEENTRGIVEAWQAIVGGLQVLAFLAKLAKWGSAIAAFAGAIWYFMKTGEIPKDIHPK